MSKFVQVVQKRLGINKFVRTKSHTGSKFSKTTLDLLCSDCSCAPVFDSTLDGATVNRQIPGRIFWLIFTSLRKDSVANYASIWTLFSPVVRGFGVHQNALNVSYRSSIGRWRHKIRKFASGIFNNAKKTRQQSCAKYFV